MLLTGGCVAHFFVRAGEIVLTVSMLVPKQGDFLVCVAHLVIWTREQGQLLTAGELWRSDEQAEINVMGEEKRRWLATLCKPTLPEFSAALENNGNAFGIRNSLHGLRLAFDGVLFSMAGGQWTLARVAAYTPLGDFWKTLDGRARWGGDFALTNPGRVDPGHFSFEHDGRK